MDNQVNISLNQMLRIKQLDFRLADKAFVHADRCLDFHVFLFITKGCMEVVEENHEYRIEKNQFFFLKKGLRHWGVKEILKGTEWYYIHFYDMELGEEQHLNEFAQLLKGHEFSEQDYRVYFTLPKQWSVDHPQTISRKLNDLCTIFRSQNELRAISLGYGVTSLFYELYTHVRSRNVSKTDVIVGKIIEYLEDNCASEIHSKDISNHMFMNYNYLSTLFKQKTGLSISQYHTRLRVKEAERLLLGTNMNISEVSNRIGYKDPLYFSHVFKKVKGISPSFYLRQTYPVQRSKDV